MPMFQAAHPGELLREWMGADISVTQLSAHLGVSRVTVSRLLNGASGLTAPMAIRLAEPFPKTDARFWMTLQANYELSRAQRKRRKPVLPVRTNERAAKHA